MKKTLIFSGILAAAVVGSGVGGQKWGGTARGDIIELKNGAKLSGSMARDGDSMVIKTDDGKTLTFRPDDIASVSLTNDITPEEAARAEWTKLSSQIKAAADLQTIIDLHKSFLVRFGNSEQSKDVRASLEVYQKLHDEGGVRFRGRWMPAAKVDVLIKQWAQAAKPSLEFYKAGRMKDALDATRDALTDDPQNPDALTIAGLAAYRLNNLPLAKTYFTSLTGADPTSVLAENNLAVIASVQKQPGEGIVHYIKALQIMPDNRLLLDNIAEAINAYTGDKNSANFRALLKQYEPAEKKMEEKLAKPENGGLKRWGSTWVAKEDYDKLVKNQGATQDQMTTLDAQYRNVRDSLAALDAQFKQASADCDTYLQNVTYYNAVLSTPQRVGDANVYLAQRDAAVQNLNRATQQRNQLQAQRDQLIANSRDILAQADKMKGSLATALATGQYTGSQRIMDLGEAETPPAPAPVTIPAPLPAPAAPTTIVINNPPASAPPPIYIPIGIPAIIQSGGGGNGGGGNGGRGDGGRGRSGRGGSSTQPSTPPPSTQPGGGSGH